VELWAFKQVTLPNAGLATSAIDIRLFVSYSVMRNWFIGLNWFRFSPPGKQRFPSSRRSIRFLHWLPGEVVQLTLVSAGSGENASLVSSDEIREDFMNPAIVWALAAMAVLIAAFLLFRILRSYFRLRGKRLVTCPQNRKPAAVSLAAVRLARDSALGKPPLRLSECSRWPELQGCGQDCLKEIEAAAEGCLVRGIVAAWYANKTCVLCGKPVDISGELVGQVPALMNPEKQTVYWDKIAVERLPEVLQTHLPVCWSCHIAETVRSEHPEMVVDRSARW
jgi:hypothetical protein